MKPFWPFRARTERRRASIKLNPSYEARRIRELRAARERFEQGART